MYYWNVKLLLEFPFYFQRFASTATRSGEKYVVFCMFQFGGASVYIYIYIYRVWSSCLAPPMGNWRSLHDWSPQRAHAYCLHRNLFRWIARRLQTPLCFKVGQRHGLRHLLRHPVTQEQSQGGAHGQIKLPHCIHPGPPGGRSPVPQFPNPWGTYDTNMPEQPRHHR